ncbi:DUF3014 domain-containing protein [Pyxidicoccus trucidator]|uniref:DUF3014 domain-containing protein n=1 Tax=Pyxidicoccus trucidator TaxID=2709662 RepID=UPI0013DB7E95|nr:DUF3014 domain-containing protein [Pyxidicoccus trucidator]
MSDPMNPTPAGASPTPPSEPPRGSRAKTLAVVLGLGGLALVATYFGVMRQNRPPEVASTPTVDAGPAVPPPAPEVSLPESDGRVRDLTSRLSSEPEFAKWLQEKDLVRRFTAAVNNVAEGASPRMVLGFLAPAGGFEVTGSGGKTQIDPRSYARYDVVARVFGSLDAQAAGSVYRELKSLIDQAHREIAPPGQPFDRTFSQAIGHLLEVSVPEGAVEVQPQGALYAYVSPELEGLSRAQKHLLRMGPQNMRTIQAKLRELQSSLGLPPVAER